MKWHKLARRAPVGPKLPSLAVRDVKYPISWLGAFGSREALDVVTGEWVEPLAGPVDLDVGARSQRAFRWKIEGKVRLALKFEDLRV